MTKNETFNYTLVFTSAQTIFFQLFLIYRVVKIEEIICKLIDGLNNCYVQSNSVTTMGEHEITFKFMIILIQCSNLKD